MKKIPPHAKFKILGVYVLIGKRWQLLTEFEHDPFMDGIPFSNFTRYRIQHIRDNNYWLWDFNDVTREREDHKKFRLQIRLLF